MSLRTGRILGIAGLVSATIAACIGLSVRFSGPVTAIKSVAARSIDISDSETRLAFLNLVRGPRLWHNSLAESCGPGSHDVARVSYWPAFEKPSMIEFDDFHGSGAMTRYELANESIMVPDPTKQLPPVLRESAALDFATLSELAADIDKLLASDEAPAIDDMAFDGAQVVVEICRRGRYFFFKRNSAHNDPSDLSPNLNRLAGKLLKFDPRQKDQKY